MKKSFKLLLVVALISALALFAVGCGGGDDTTPGTDNTQTGTAEKITVKFSHVASALTPKGLAAQKFADLVAEKSGGNIEVRVYPSSQLYGDNDEMEALQSGNVNFIAPSAGKLVTIDPRFQLPDVPFVFNDEEASNRFWDGEGGQELFASLETQGIKGLTSWPNGMRQWINNKHAVIKPEDMKGLKFRIPSGGIMTEMHELLGAGASGIAFAEVYTALQQGTVNGTVASLDNIKSERYYENCKYLTVANINSLNYVVLTNLDWWNGLSDENRAVMEEALTEATEYERQISLEKNSLTEGSEIQQLLKDANVEIDELTDEQKDAFRTVLDPILADAAKSIGQDLLDKAYAANEAK